MCRIVVTYQNLLSAVDSLARAQPRQQQLLPQALRQGIIVLLHLALELGDFSRVAASARLLEPIRVVHQALGRIPRPRRFVETLRFAGVERS